MSARTAIISDIHGNLPALHAVIEDIEQTGCGKVFLLGDLINGVDPHGCVEFLQNWSEKSRIPLSCIKGNAEAYLFTPERFALPRQDETWNQEVIALVQWFEDHLSAQDLAWIRTFPQTLLWERSCGVSYLVHDSPMDRLAALQTVDPLIRPEHREWFFHGNGITPDLQGRALAELLEYMQGENYDQIFCGHTHQAFYKTFNGRLVCNAGSVGAPLDGDLRAAWVLLEDDPGLPVIRRVAYDIGLQLKRIDQTLDYPGFSQPFTRERYKLWIQTGKHWKTHLQG